MNLHYKTLDFFLSRSYFLSKRLYIAPDFGLKAAWVNIEEKIHYSGLVSADDDDLTSGGSISVKNVSRFSGVGAAGGASVRCYVAEGFSFYGNGDVGLLLGNFTLSDTNSGPLLPNFQNHIQRLIPNLGLALGISYETAAKGERNRIELSLGYESQLWSNIYRAAIPLSFFSRFDASGLNDLALYGATFHFEWDF